MILRRHISNKKYVDTYVPYLLGGPEVIIPTFKIFFRHYSGQTNKLAEGAASTWKFILTLYFASLRSWDPHFHSSIAIDPYITNNIDPSWGIASTKNMPAPLNLQSSVSAHLIEDIRREVLSHYHVPSAAQLLVQWQLGVKYFDKGNILQIFRLRDQDDLFCVV